MRIENTLNNSKIYEYTYIVFSYYFTYQNKPIKAIHTDTKNFSTFLLTVARSAS